MSDKYKGDKRVKKLLFTITIFLIQITFAFTPIEKGDMIFEISGFKNNDGKAVLYLFREEDEIPEKPFKIVLFSSAIKQPRCS